VRKDRRRSFTRSGFPSPSRALELLARSARGSPRRRRVAGSRAARRRASCGFGQISRLRRMPRARPVDSSTSTRDSLEERRAAADSTVPASGRRSPQHLLGAHADHRSSGPHMPVSGDERGPPGRTISSAVARAYGCRRRRHPAVEVASHADFLGRRLGVHVDEITRRAVAIFFRSRPRAERAIGGAMNTRRSVTTATAFAVS